MKILIAQYEMLDLGGIVNDLESLYQGLVELGIEVHVRQMCWKESVRDKRTSQTDLIQGKMGLLFNQKQGWIWPESHRVPYMGVENLRQWRMFAETFDAVVWHIPVPSASNENVGNSDWLRLYDISVPQFAYIHDGNLRDSYPHIYAVKDKLKGLAATQGAALGCAKLVDLPHALVLTGQMDIQKRIDMRQPWSKRSHGFYSNFTAKGWKHLEDLVRAIPHMSPVLFKIYAGNGIALRYMKATDKCPPKFWCDKEYDPDFNESWNGKRIWENALLHGLIWKDYVHPDERDLYMSHLRVHIDPSWSIKYSKLGSHFNRTTVESMISGCVPIARNLGVGIDETGICDPWIPGETYAMIPYDCTPKQFAKKVEETICMDESSYMKMLENWDKIIWRWDYRRVAANLLRLILKTSEHPVGSFSEDVKRKSDEMMSHFKI